MIRSPLGLRIDPARPARDQIQEAARRGARGVVIDAIGELGPDRLSETGRRSVRHLLRSTELALIAVSLPTRRPFDTEDQLDDRLRRADRAFAMAFELGSPLVLIRMGPVPPESSADRRAIFVNALRELDRRAEHRGVRLALETGTESGEVMRALLDGLDLPGVAASIDPGALLAAGHDPVTTTRELGERVAHAYANDATGPSRLTSVANPRGFGFPPGALDWEEYLGALEEINYRGYLTIWPDPAQEPGPQFAALAERLRSF